MNTSMRTSRDRIRHALLFEIIMILVCTPLLSFILHKPLETMGVMGVIMSLLAMGWNYLYNLLFDHALIRLDRPLYPRSLVMRTVHALLFEGGFALVSIPMVMVWLHFSFFNALMFDLAFLLVVPIYTLLYNGLYDRVFPMEGFSGEGIRAEVES